MRASSAPANERQVCRWCVGRIASPPFMRAGASALLPGRVADRTYAIMPQTMGHKPLAHQSSIYQVVKEPEHASCMAFLSIASPSEANASGRLNRPYTT